MCCELVGASASTTPNPTPTATPSGSSVPSAPPGDNWQLQGGSGQPVATGICTGCKGDCEAEEGVRTIWITQFESGNLRAIGVREEGPKPVELENKPAHQIVKDGTPVHLKIPVDVGLHVVGDKAELKYKDDIIPGECQWGEPTPGD